MVTIGFNGTYSVREDAGVISIVVLVLMNSLARDVEVTFSTQDNTARGGFVQYQTCSDLYQRRKDILELKMAEVITN